MRAGRHGPVCTVVFDLGIPLGGNPDSIQRTLAARSGVLTVEALDGGWRARVCYDQMRTTLPALWNWVVASSRGEPEGPATPPQASDQ